jgi:hypothetical protein
MQCCTRRTSGWTWRRSGGGSEYFFIILLLQTIAILKNKAVDEYLISFCVLASKKIQNLEKENFLARKSSSLLVFDVDNHS